MQDQPLNLMCLAVEASAIDFRTASALAEVGQSKRECDGLRRSQSSQRVWRLEFNNIDTGVGLCLFDCSRGENVSWRRTAE